MTLPARSDSKSPNLIGRRVRMRASDHPFAGQTGTVIAQVECHLCKEDGWGCGYDDLVVELDDGTKASVYEPEAEVVS